mgnify:CR=1 FL=1
MNQSTHKKTDIKSQLIPKSLSLGGLKINVQFDTSLIEKCNKLCEADYLSQHIFIDPSKTPLQTTEQAYFYNLVKWIFFLMSENDHMKNHKLISSFAQYLYQAISSAEKTEPKNKVINKSQEQEDPQIRSLITEENPFIIPIPWWSEDGEESEESLLDEDYCEIEYQLDGQGVIIHEPEDSNDGFYTQNYFDAEPDDCHSAEMELLEMEWAEEQESLEAEQEEMAAWSSYADSWARSEEDGWFYED